MSAELPTNFRRERQVAVAAVLQASLVARRIFASLISPQDAHQPNVLSTSITKVDQSPVTVGDFTIQALINLILSKYFPEDEIVGEEDSTELPTAGSLHLEQIIQFANQALNEDRLSIKADEEIWSKFRNEAIKDAQELRQLIDLGQSQGGNHGQRRRFWTLDPIDGTKGFLRGGQYAICLALIIDGKVVLGVIGAPNLAAQGPPTTMDPTAGLLFVAEKDCGAFQRAFGSEDYSRIRMLPHTLDSLAIKGRFCESYESSHSDQGLTADIANRLQMANFKNPLRIDSQAKYCVLARGDSDIYLRFPTKPNYQEKIWDHAAGNILISESDGKVADLHGKPLDFSIGRTLANNYPGFLACHQSIFPSVLKVVQEVFNSRQKV
ncbi:hypothetical protein O181_010631 [Austropuccinia psidii MF-1]|uniref:3'(2'),5'-bisphosphate nucleotidase n=1 Tax=Austropuccinia psidii MF-1 TaxID=1389203 RepID=A0A9Q3BU63_9BASI|nr:hypothetical protein [Austropuccinia psidii MF-1]